MYKELMDYITNKEVSGIKKAKSENPNIPESDTNQIAKDNKLEEMLDYAQGGMSVGGVEKLKPISELAVRKVADIVPDIIKPVNPKIMNIIEANKNNPDWLSWARSQIDHPDALKVIENYWMKARSKANEASEIVNQMRNKVGKIVNSIDSAYNPNFKIEQAGHLDPLKEINKNNLLGETTQVIDTPTQSFSKLANALKKGNK